MRLLARGSLGRGFHPGVRRCGPGVSAARAEGVARQQRRRHGRPGRGGRGRAPLAEPLRPLPPDETAAARHAAGLQDRRRRQPRSLPGRRARGLGRGHRPLLGWRPLVPPLRPVQALQRALRRGVAPAPLGGRRRRLRRLPGPSRHRHLSQGSGTRGGPARLDRPALLPAARRRSGCRAARGPGGGPRRGPVLAPQPPSAALARGARPRPRRGGMGRQ
mmetsp:Transcript_49702/g.100087  ORF Transcript_49702/g.100087 Transcript_49702/m.100087 type:complete len:218 (-) Transcript_49702:19-672(-)